MFEICIREVQAVKTRNFSLSIQFWTILKYMESCEIERQEQRLIREPNAENCLDLIFVPSPCEKDVILPGTIQTVSHLESENSCWTCQVLIASKI